MRARLDGVGVACKSCGVEKPATEEFFPPARANTLHATCRQCVSRKQRAAQAARRRRHVGDEHRDRLLHGNPYAAELLDRLTQGWGESPPDEDSPQ